MCGQLDFVSFRCLADSCLWTEEPAPRTAPLGGEGSLRSVVAVAVNSAPRPCLSAGLVTSTSPPVLLLVVLSSCDFPPVETSPLKNNADNVLPPAG